MVEMEIRMVEMEEVVEMEDLVILDAYGGWWGKFSMEIVGGACNGQSGFPSVSWR
jgi:hypothetical protein